MAHTEDMSQEDLENEQRKILVIEDDPSVLISITHLLRKNKMQVLTDTMWTEAIDVLERDEPDLILLDLVMPNVDGVNLLKSMRDNGVMTPVVVVSASIDKAVRGEMSGLGIAAFIAKPFRVNVLLREIWRILDPPFYQGIEEYQEGDAVMLASMPESSSGSSDSSRPRRWRRRRGRSKSKVEEFLGKWERRFPNVSLSFLILMGLFCLILASILAAL